MVRHRVEEHDHPGDDRPLLLLRGAVAVAAAGLLVAVLVAPVAIGAGTVLAQASTGVDATSTGVVDDGADAVTVVTDAAGTPIALLYRRFRLPVGAERINDTMRAAIVAIEDRRFYAHEGVDPRGVARAIVTNAVSGRRSRARARPRSRCSTSRTSASTPWPTPRRNVGPPPRTPSDASSPRSVSPTGSPTGSRRTRSSPGTSTSSTSGVAPTASRPRRAPGSGRAPRRSPCRRRRCWPGWCAPPAATTRSSTPRRPTTAATRCSPR